ncbi:MAG: hypothetical protein H6626_06685 [Pseudobdellovibrionaceae bacterium]|nr:hypothetical protein [Bdellovibrionales bacterium]USN48771.1 MAG: hypothetical protein H6626_06685 [Pseudobdellovibrionaceae bacterium]
MKKFTLRLPLLLLVGLCLWVAIYPNQLELVGDIFSKELTRTRVKAFEEAFKKRNVSIYLSSICDQRLKDLGDLKIEPSIFCTAKACLESNPCCNICGVHSWRIGDTNFYLLNKDIQNITCEVDGCGNIKKCNPKVILLSVLRKKCSD